MPNRRIVPMPTKTNRQAPMPPMPPAVFPAHRAVPPPSSWPPKNFDVMALVFTTCLMAVFWPYRHVILLAVGIYYLGRGWFWLCRNYPRTAWFVFGFLQGLLGGGRRRKGGDFQNPRSPFRQPAAHPGELAALIAIIPEFATKRIARAQAIMGQIPLRRQLDVATLFLWNRRSVVRAHPTVPTKSIT